MEKRGDQLNYSRKRALEVEAKERNKKQDLKKQLK